MAQDLTSAVSSLGGTQVSAEFFRYAPPQARLVGSSAGGRWSPPNGFPAYYFAGSRDSAIAEIYRRIINASSPPLPPNGIILALSRYSIEADHVLDLRTTKALETVGLTPANIRSGLGDYSACQEIAKIAHQCGYHGVIAPAASGLGVHLALFDQQLELSERPQLVETEILQGIPANPLRLRAVDDADAHA